MSARTAPWYVVIAVVLAACAGSSSASECERIPGVREGLCLIDVDARQDAPGEAMPLVGAPDEQRSLTDERGKVVVVNFWASWCGPCRTEQPDLNAAHERLPDDEVAFLGVNIEDSQTNAQAHVREFGIAYPSLFDPGTRFASRWQGVGPRTIPSTMIIDAQGRVAARVFGVIGLSEVLGLVEAVASENVDG